MGIQWIEEGLAAAYFTASEYVHLYVWQPDKQGFPLQSTLEISTLINLGSG